MKKSSAAISLVLLSSTVLYFGCSRECKPLANGQPDPKCHGNHPHTGGHIMPGGHIVPGGGTTTSAPSTGTPRGGFGTSGATSSSS